jgi:acyl-coenzyme A synthetase/AMP-(fatty) acid ligase
MTLFVTASLEYPRLVWIVDALPKGPTGKILKREIQAPTGLLDRTAAVTNTSTA